MAPPTELPDWLRAGATLTGSLFPEPVEVVLVSAMGSAVRVVGKGLRTGTFIDTVLSSEQLKLLSGSPAEPKFDGDPRTFRLGVEAQRLGLAYEYDPFFALSVAKIDPLPHQLEAVYDYMLKQPRIRFLLADDAGAGKTIMAGLLLKELKARGLVQRVLILAPANLTVQWQHELQERFRETFDLFNRETLAASFGRNPWQERSQVVTSVSWVSRIDEAKESLLRSSWDLIIVDEAHRLNAQTSARKTLAYRLGEELFERASHVLLMTATPHRGDPEGFRLFLSLLDRDVYGDARSLEDALRRKSAPFYLRRTKEALVSFPDPVTGVVRKLFPRRVVRTVAFELGPDEHAFYERLTAFVEEHSRQASGSGTARARTVGFIMVMLQRRAASSVYSARRSLERMLEGRELALAKTASQRLRTDLSVPDEEEPEGDYEVEIAPLEVNALLGEQPEAIQREITQLKELLELARALEERGNESKASSLRKLLDEQEVSSNPKNKLLIFTEHRDTLDFLAGDGLNGRPVGLLRRWGLQVVTIHGSMSLGSRDETGTRLHAEREFRERAQILVATEAAGEGINLQFCRLLVNYDIPWSPIRLEQRMGRIHRYGQDRDCLVFNFVASNTREGHVLGRLLERLAEIRIELGTDHVFDVIGELLPAKTLEDLFRQLYAKQLGAGEVEERIVQSVDTERFLAITESALEGLAKRELNLAALAGRAAEAREFRASPELLSRFFLEAARLVGAEVEESRHGGPYRLRRLPPAVLEAGARLEPRFGRLGRHYARFTFEPAREGADGHPEFVTPGHPLFEAVRAAAEEEARAATRSGAVYYDVDATAPYLLHVFSGAIRDGRGRQIHKRLHVIREGTDGKLTVHSPGIFSELLPQGAEKSQPALPDAPATTEAVDAFGLSSLQPLLETVTAERGRELDVISRHVEISLGELIRRTQERVTGLRQSRESGQAHQGLEGRLAIAEAELEEHERRLANRRRDLARERQLSLSDLARTGRAWVLPHRAAPRGRREPDLVQQAISAALKYESSFGCSATDVCADRRGFDVLSRRGHVSDPNTVVEVRHILARRVENLVVTEHELATASRLARDAWLYVLDNDQVVVLRDPAQLAWRPIADLGRHEIGRDEFPRLRASSDPRSATDVSLELRQACASANVPIAVSSDPERAGLFLRLALRLSELLVERLPTVSGVTLGRLVQEYSPRVGEAQRPHLERVVRRRNELLHSAKSRPIDDADLEGLARALLYVEADKSGSRVQPKVPATGDRAVVPAHVAALARRIVESRKSMLLIAPRRWGRTSFLRHLTGWVRERGRRILDLGSAPFENTVGWLRAAISGQGSAELEVVVSAAGEFDVVILEDAQAFSEDASGEALALLRACASKTSFVLGCTPAEEGELSSRGLDFSFASPFWLPALDPTSALELVRRFGQDAGLLLDDQAAHACARMSGGLPWHAKEIVSALQTAVTPIEAALSAASAVLQAQTLHLLVAPPDDLHRADVIEAEALDARDLLGLETLGLVVRRHALRFDWTSPLARGAYALAKGHADEAREILTTGKPPPDRAQAMRGVLSWLEREAPDSHSALRQRACLPPEAPADVTARALSLSFRDPSALALDWLSRAELRRFAKELRLAPEDGSAGAEELAGKIVDALLSEGRSA